MVYIASGDQLNDREVDDFRSQINRQCSLNDSHTVMGIIARFDPWKGIDITLRAAAPLLRQNPSLRLMIIGGPFRNFHLEYESYLKKSLMKKKFRHK